MEGGKGRGKKLSKPSQIQTMSPWLRMEVRDSKRRRVVLIIIEAFKIRTQNGTVGRRRRNNEGSRDRVKEKDALGYHLPGSYDLIKGEIFPVSCRLLFLTSLQGPESGIGHSDNNATCSIYIMLLNVLSAPTYALFKQPS